MRMWYVVEEAVLHEVPEEMLDSGKVRLRKEFNLFGCIASLIGTVVGLGIFGSPTVVAESVGNFPTAIILWAAYGIVAGLGAVTYADIGSAIPISGGDYIYMTKLYGPLGGYFYQITLNFLIGPVFKAILAAWSAAYLLRIFLKKADVTATEFPKDFYFGASVLAVLLILFSTVICCLSTRLVKWLSQVWLGFKCITLLVIVGISLYAFGKKREIFDDNMKYVNVTPSMCNKDSNIHKINVQENLFGITKAIYAVAFSYHGWSSSNYFTEEFKVPTRTLKVGMVISFPFIFIIYMSIIMCYSLALPIDELKFNEIPTKLFMKWIKVNEVQWVMPTLVGIFLFGTLVNYTNAVSRVPFVGARYGHAPKLFSFLHLTRLTPIPSLVFQSFVAIIYAPFGLLTDFRILVGAALYLEMLFSFIAVSGFIYWTFRNSSISRPFKVLIIIPITYTTITFCILLLPFISADWNFLSLGCSWPEILAILITLTIIAVLGLLSYHLFVKQKVGFCLSLDRQVLRMYKNIFHLGEENDPRDTFLQQFLHEGKAGKAGKGEDIPSPLDGTFSNISSQTKVLLNNN